MTGFIAKRAKTHPKGTKGEKTLYNRGALIAMAMRALRKNRVIHAGLRE